MTTEQKKLYRQFRAAHIGGIVGQDALNCLRAAKTVDSFRALEDDRVRIVAEPEQENYFDVYGEPDTAKERQQIIDSIETYGCYHVAAQVKCPKCGEWQFVDGIGMCAGYKEPTSPFENPYVIDLMATALSSLA